MCLDQGFVFSMVQKHRSLVLNQSQVNSEQYGHNRGIQELRGVLDAIPIHPTAASSEKLSLTSPSLLCWHWGSRRQRISKSTCLLKACGCVCQNRSAALYVFVLLECQSRAGTPLSLSPYKSGTKAVSLALQLASKSPSFKGRGFAYLWLGNNHALGGWSLSC